MPVNYLAGSVFSSFDTNSVPVCLVKSPESSLGGIEGYTAESCPDYAGGTKLVAHPLQGWLSVIKSLASSV